MKKSDNDDFPEVSRETVIVNKLGIHGGPAARFVKVANRFKCLIFVEKDGEVANGKSMMGLMFLAAGPGTKILIRARGVDAGAAVEALAKVVEGKFGEE